MNELSIVSLRPAAAVVDQARIARAVREILIALGEDPDRDGLADTPARVARSLVEQTAGLRADPGAHLARTFEAAHGDLVVVRDLDFASLCEHHLLPFWGRAHVAYQPAAGRVVGLSKLARALDDIARRPQVQERLGHDLARAIAGTLAPAGVAVVLEAQHTCMSVRGARQRGAVTTTIAAVGTLAEPARRAELIALIRSRS
jgi:GTP cyclohydrolase I